jgi:hypothetical protein
MTMQPACGEAPPSPPGERAVRFWWRPLPPTPSRKGRERFGR